MLTRPLHSVVWNLFLAIIPVVLSVMIALGIKQDRKAGRVRWLIWAPLLMVWFAFLPNTVYLITEWRHYLDQLVQDPHVYRLATHSPADLFDFLLMSGFYIAYSGCGLLCFFMAVYPLDQLVKTPPYVKPVFFLLIALGVYLGLVDRFNSWQVVHHLHPILRATRDALSRSHTVLVMIVFAVVLWILYEIFCLTADGLKYRRRPLKSK